MEVAQATSKVFSLQKVSLPYQSTPSRSNSSNMRLVRMWGGQLPPSVPFIGQTAKSLPSVKLTLGKDFLKGLKKKKKPESPSPLLCLVVAATPCATGGAHVAPPRAALWPPLEEATVPQSVGRTPPKGSGTRRAVERGEDAAARIRRSPWPWREGWRPPPAPPPAEDGYALTRTDPPAPPPPSTTCRRSSSRWPSSPGEEGRGRRSQVVLPAAGHVLAAARGREATAHRRPHRPPALLLARQPLLLLARPPPFLLAPTAAAAPLLG